MKSEKSGTLFGGPVVLPKGPNQDAAASQSEQSATDGIAVRLYGLGVSEW